MQHPKSYDAIPELPCVVYNGDLITENYHQLKAYLSQRYPRNRLFFALKACYLAPVVAKIVELGCGLEITTTTEHAIASRMGVQGNRIIWNGPAMDTEVLRSIILRQELINIDSPQIFHDLGKTAQELRKRIPAGLRLNPTGQGKFGMAPDQVPEFLSSAGPVDVKGFSIHISRRSVEPQHEMRDKLDFLDAAAAIEKDFNLQLDYIDLGGGLPGSTDFRSDLEPLLERLLAFRYTPELFLEPGAYLVERAATAFSRVIAMKTVGQQQWAILDIGANFLVPLDRSHFTVEPLCKSRAESCLSFGGPFCFDADVIAPTRRSVAVKVGDVVRIGHCGAYTSSMASCFGAAPPPVYWSIGGSVEKVKRDPDSQDLFMRMHGYF